ncbi:hypothetical protein [Spirosoma utsteinense]|uniref:PleD family two-component response regulator n=1 Tax=Spirosoma utsteinense TaxID=2585773 RepID=A0ABR6W2W4_9BACT|nr:hypothetical protein [Spirosoma utsteinense]MBC3784956.1 PleD family two-component response regulator [Spirosoma utsteinense]MBC3790436.1 PleD family two-component response regulator [Spirosoma utsteinense]
MRLLSVLIITTNQHECSSLTEAFTNDGVRVHCITKSPDSDVLRWLDEAAGNDPKRPSLIIVDLDDSNGYRTSIVPQLKKHPYCSATPVIAFSRNNDSSFVERLYQQGTISVFKRPQDWTQFARTLLTYWTQSDVRLPNEPTDEYSTQRWGTLQHTGLPQYPRSQAS